MKKLSKITIFSVIVLALSAGVFSVMAAQPGDPGYSPITSIEGLLGILNNIVNVLYYAFFIVAIGFVILAAFDYLTGGDDPEKIKGATKKIMYAAVAIVVVLISKGAAVIINDLITRR